MPFFVGDLVVSVSGCCIDENAGPLLNPCVELSVGNKLHSTRLPVELRGGTVGDGEGGSRKRRSSAVAFHGVTERDVLMVTVLDRSPPPSSTAPDGRTRPPYVAEAKPLRCTHWGSGGRPTRRTCVMAPPEEVQELASGGSAVGRDGGDPRGRGGTNSGGGIDVLCRGGESTVQLAICWSPAIRLKRPLSLVARAGRLTARVVSRKIDRPAAAVLNLGLGGAEKACDFFLFGDPRLKAAALVASAVSLSLGSAVVVAAAACFLPVMLALSAAAAATFATLAPPALALTWVFACTGPACEQLWRPLLVWTGTRWGSFRRLLLLPLEIEAESWGEGGDDGDRGVLLKGPETSAMGEEAARRWLPPPSAADGRQAEEKPNAIVPVGGEGSQDRRGGVRNGGNAADAGAVVLLLACYQNLIGVLHTGLEASRWRPRPR
ncbi:unnamed protein product [Ectocarpus sp. 4 AP-2014]